MHNQKRKILTESRKQDFIWNTLAGVINAAEAVVMSMTVTRLGVLSDAGILSYAFAIGNVLMSIGTFGGRIYQVTDTNKRYSFRLYMNFRIITVTIMLIILVILKCVNNYEHIKDNAVTTIMIMYTIECFEDCIWGYFQQNNCLYWGARMFATRWIAILVIFILGMIVNGDLVASLRYGAVSGGVVFLFWIIVIRRNIIDKQKITKETKFAEANQLVDLLKQMVPLFLASFCSILISNLPKIAIERYVNDEVQACYGFVAMPVFVISLLSQFTYQPNIVKSARKWADADYTCFKREINKQLLIIFAISLICIGGTSAFGIPVLNLIYNTDLKDYWRELVVLQISGGFLAITGYISIVLTVMRKQKQIITGYVLSALCGIIIVFLETKNYGTYGATLGNLFTSVLLASILYCMYKRTYQNTIITDAGRT